MSKDFTIEDKLKSVIKLQKINSKVDELNTLKGELPQIISDLDDDITGLTTRMNRNNDEIEQIEENIKDRREAKKNAKSLIEKYEDQSNEVKNKREFDALNKEIESAELEIKHIDKLIREENGRLNELKDNNVNIQQRVDDLTSKKEEKEAELDKILQNTEKEETELNEKADEQKQSVEQRILKAYTNLRNNFKNGQAVVPVERDACGGCFNQVPPQKQAEIAQHKKIIACEHCGRILIDPELYESVKID